MARDWIDADYEVVEEPRPRRGQYHRTLRGWRFFGIDAYGRELWRRPPRLPRWGWGILFVLGFCAFQTVVYLIAEFRAHH